MSSKRRSLTPIVSALALITLAIPATALAARLSAVSSPEILALTSPADGAALSAGVRPTFAWEATPGGRFRVEFSTTVAPFLPVVTSGRRTTAGDQFQPNTTQWRAIRALAAGGAPVYWRVVAYGMSPAQVEAVPVASFTVVP